jgi:hypothetical protein
MAWKKQDNPDEEVALMSKINAAGIINITIENLWRDVYFSMAKNDFSTWNRKLDAIWLILGGEKDSPEKQFNEIDLELHETGELSLKAVGFSNLPDGWQEKRSTQYLLLRKKSLFLRKLQNSQGKGTAYASEDEDDFD